MGQGAVHGHSYETEGGKLEWVNKMGCFEHLDSSEKKDVASYLEVMKAHTGESIVRQGTPGQIFGLLVQGELKITAVGPNGAEIELCKQSPGYYFGEAALMGDTTTTASITCVSNSVLLVLNRKTLLKLTEHVPAVRESLMDTITTRLRGNLKTIPFFSMLDESKMSKEYRMMGALDLLSNLFDVMQVPDKHVICREGELADAFYVIVEGCVRVSASVKNPLDGKGKDILLTMLTKNDYFGEIALIEKTTRTATVRAFEPCLLMCIPKERFERFLQVAPPFEELIANMSHARVARTLKNLDMFKVLTDEQRNQLSLVVEFREYKPQHILLRQHEAVTGLYIVLAGSLSQFAHDAHNDTDIDLGDVEPGMVVGEISLLAGVDAHATLTVKDKCRLLWLSVEKFRRFLPLAPALHDQFIDLARERRKISMLKAPNNIIPEIFTKDEEVSALRSKNELLTGQIIALESELKIYKEAFPDFDPETASEAKDNLK